MRVSLLSILRTLDKQTPVLWIATTDSESTASAKECTDLGGDEFYNDSYDLLMNWFDCKQKSRNSYDKYSNVYRIDYPSKENRLKFFESSIKSLSLLPVQIYNTFKQLQSIKDNFHKVFG